MMDIYGKLKNGKLILAPRAIVRDGKSIFDAEDVYRECGYKIIKYIVGQFSRQNICHFIMNLC